MLGNVGRGADQFMLRLPDGMRDRIKLAADLNGRSMNAEIVGVLEEKYPPSTSTPEMQQLYRLMTKYLHDRDNFTDQEEMEMNGLIVTIRMHDVQK